MPERKQDDQSGEEHLIDYFRPLAREAGALGLLDDAAFLTPPDNCDLVLTKDAIVAGIHFLPGDPPDVVARKALRVNLSDLAAKGAEPAGFLMALAMPEGINGAWIAAFARALGEDADTYRCPLFGGDTVRTSGPLMVSITALGTVPRGAMVRRGGAKAGDRVVVTGTIGDAALGLKLHQDASMAQRWELDRVQADYLKARYWVPQPRNAVAPALRRHASAAMDVSDGLAGDFAKLCRVSGVTAEIEAARVPLSDAARAALDTDPMLIETLLTGGDDYEIICTVPSGEMNAFVDAAAQAGVPVSELGRVVAGTEAPRFLGRGGKPIALRRASFSHF